MKRVLTLLTVLLLTLSAFGQRVLPGRSWAFKPPGGAPAIESLATNQAGYPVLAWYKSPNYGTNTYPIWTDSWTNSWNLTNMTGGAGSPTMTLNAINGYPSVDFNADNTTYLRTALYASAQPHEVFLVLQPSTYVSGHHIFDGTGSASRNGFWKQTTGQNCWSIYAGTVMSAPINSWITNQWFIMDLIYLGSSSGFYTNNVLLKSADAGANASAGITVGARYGLTFPGTFSLAEVISYGGGYAIPGTNTVARSNVWYYLKTKYAL